MDRFSKMCILMPCKKNITVEQTAKLYFQNVWVHFGFPTSIFSDRDSRFIGNFWSNLWRMMGTKLKKSTSFHPQADGQTKVVNRTVVHLLRGYCIKHPKLWDEQMHSFITLTTGQSPLQHKPHLLKYALGICQNRH